MTGAAGCPVQLQVSCNSVHWTVNMLAASCLIIFPRILASFDFSPVLLYVVIAMPGTCTALHAILWHVLSP